MLSIRQEHTVPFYTGEHGNTEICHCLLFTSFVAVTGFCDARFICFSIIKVSLCSLIQTLSVIRCADSLFSIEELLSILCTVGAILREAIFVIDRLCPVGVRINLRDSRRACS